jgi:hypothetical protein
LLLLGGAVNSGIDLDPDIYSRFRENSRINGPSTLTRSQELRRRTVAALKDFRDKYR